MPREVSGRRELDRPAGHPIDERRPELRAGRVIPSARARRSRPARRSGSRWIGRRRGSGMPRPGPAPPRHFRTPRRPRHSTGPGGTSPGPDRRPRREMTAASARASPPIPAQRWTTIGQAENRPALCRATGSAVACSTPTGSTHIRSPRSNFSAAFRRASTSRTAADTNPAGALFRSRASSAGPIDRTAATSSSSRRPSSVVKRRNSASIPPGSFWAPAGAGSGLE